MLQDTLNWRAHFKWFRMMENEWKGLLFPDHSESEFQEGWPKISLFQKFFLHFGKTGISVNFFKFEIEYKLNFFGKKFNQRMWDAFPCHSAYIQIAFASYPWLMSISLRIPIQKKTGIQIHFFPNFSKISSAHPPIINGRPLT